MSANNGDKSRFGRQRKRKINRRIKIRQLRREMGVPEQAAPAKSKG